MKLSIRVYGKPLAKGSAQAFIGKTKKGERFAGIRPANPKLEAWEQAIRAAAVKAMDGRKLIREPVAASMLFFFARPQAHYGTGRNAGQLKASAPTRHSQTPDLDKLVRAVFDALTGIVFDDDRCVFRFREPFEKRWSEAAEHVVITIETEGE